MSDKKSAGGMKAVPNTVCPSCKFNNEMGAIICKKCGDFLTSAKKQKTKTEGEYDPTEGALTPGCFVAIGAVILAALIFLLLAFKGGPKEGTCEHNKSRIGKAVISYNKANPGNKMKVLDLDKLTTERHKGKPYLKDKPVCPVDPTAKYSLDEHGTPVCSKCK